MTIDRWLMVKKLSEKTGCKKGGCYGMSNSKFYHHTLSKLKLGIKSSKEINVHEVDDVD